MRAVYLAHTSARIDAFRLGPRRVAHKPTPRAGGDVDGGFGIGGMTTANGNTLSFLFRYQRSQRGRPPRPPQRLTRTWRSMALRDAPTGVVLLAAEALRRKCIMKRELPCLHDDSNSCHSVLLARLRALQRELSSITASILRLQKHRREKRADDALE